VEVPEIDVDELEHLAPSGPALIDVRRPDEWVAFRVPGATHIPMDEIEARIDEVPTDGPVFVICHSGVRSRRVAEFLRAHGVDARNVAGGSQAWADAGFPTESGE
jgi:rhodanese-related sulfurtransferase